MDAFPINEFDLLSLGENTRALHGDDEHIGGGAAVAPSISVSTTFRHPVPTNLDNNSEAGARWDPWAPDVDLYSRYTQPTLTRAEKVLASLLGYPTIAYTSGLTAVFAALLHYNPEVIAITEGKGYHGCHLTVERFKRMRGEQLKVIDINEPFTNPKTLCWIETPLNPTGECHDIKHYVDKIRALNSPDAKLVVDSTFGPPPLQDPFKQGADAVMHSGTKYFGGHSDLLVGTLSVKTKEEWTNLHGDRTFLGLVPGSLEAWLLLRSLRTLHLRVPRQSATATALASWLSEVSNKPDSVVEKVWHASLQEGGKFVGEGKQMSSGPPTFSIQLRDPLHAKVLPFTLKLFTTATSLGGVETLIEQRVTSDPKADPRIVRISIGLENVEDLKADLELAFEKLVNQSK